MSIPKRLKYNQTLTLDSVAAENIALKQMSKKYNTFCSKEFCQEMLNLTVNGQPIFELSGVALRKLTARAKTTNLGTGRHYVKLRMIQPIETPSGEVLHPEIVLKNSYDGYCSMVASFGIFRQVCSNGFVIKTKDFGEMKIRHIGTPTEQAKELLKQFFGQCLKFATIHQEMEARQLSQTEIKTFVQKAVELRMNKKIEDVEVIEIAKPTRPEDEGNDAWRVFNRVQEVIINGGVKIDGRKMKAMATSPLQMKLNEKLFSALNEITGIIGTPMEMEDLITAEMPTNAIPELIETFIGIETDLVEEVLTDEIVTSVPPKRIRKTINGVRQTIDNPAYAQWLESQEI